jgi:protein-S-isoprenylcysteine O-methyltransferase Ste14
MSIAVGSVLVAIGLAIRALASGHVKKNELLTTTGPYAYTRNPLYLGSIVLACGFLIAARSWWVALLAVLMLIAIYLPVVRAEEAFLRARFPEYEEYALHVPRFVPGRLPYRGSTGSFSRHLYWKHREYNAALGAALLITVLIGKLIWLRK